MEVLWPVSTTISLFIFHMVVSVQKVLLDQLLFSPVFLGVFFTYNGIMEGHNIQGIRAKFESVSPFPLPHESHSLSIRVTSRP